MSDYSMWVVEYARVSEFPVGAALNGRYNQGTIVLPYCYVVLESADNTVVVDTGYDHCQFGKVLADKFGVSDWQPPDVVLPRIGIEPADVDTAILTHNHFDHAGGLEYFPNAHVYLQEREVQKYVSIAALPDRMQWLTVATDPDHMLSLIARMNEGKVTLLDGEAEVLPGITAVPAHDTHTPGSQYVAVDQHDGRWLLAGDLCYVYDNFVGSPEDGRFIPIGLAFGSLEECMLKMEEMYTYVGEEVTRIVPFHEQEMWTTFPSMVFPDSLHVAELSLAPGEASHLDPQASVSA